MPETIESIVARIEDGTRPGFRGRLVARGLARSIIWSDGQVPPGAVPFSPVLSADLISYGLALFSLGLRLRDFERTNPAATRAFERSAEAIEAVVHDGDPEWAERGFYTILAAAAYHLGHFSARAFSLLGGHLAALNISAAEKGLALLMLRDLSSLRNAIRSWVGESGAFDEALTRQLKSVDGDLDFEQALQLTLDSLFHRGLAWFDFALETGDSMAKENAILLFREGIDAAADAESVPYWWIFTIARHLLDDLWDESLHIRLPNPVTDVQDSKWSELRQLFIASLLCRNVAEIDLWPSQLTAAARALNVNDDLVAALPTSAGKTRIAELCILRTLALGKRVVFVTPLRALSAQTERTLRNTFTPLGFSVSSLYGSSGVTGEDANSLKSSNIVVSTPEKLDFALRNDATLIDDVGLIVLDEAHTIGAGEREVRYEVLVQRLLRRADAATRRIVCLSAILPQGDQLNDFVSWIRQDEPGEPISCEWRPTRQRFGEIVWEENRAKLTFRIEAERPFVNPFVASRPAIAPRRKPFPASLQELTLASAWRLVDEGQTVLIYCPQRNLVEPIAITALDLSRRGFLPTLLSPDKTHLLQEALNIGREWLGDNHPAVQCLRLGVALHHGQLPRPFQRAVEHLLRSGVLKITISSPTLAQGLNLSATTVLFHSLFRAGKLIPGEEFANVAGRAGRAFVDVEGQVLCVAWQKTTLWHWDKLLESGRDRNIRSGLVRLVLLLLGQLAKQTRYQINELTEYVMGNAAAWDAPKPTEDEPNLPQIWRDQLASLDSALLSLLQGDAEIGQLGALLDEALRSSLWQRTLVPVDDSHKTLARAILLGRAGFIWQNSTPAQRKGYFFAGLGLDTGRYLDHHAAVLNAYLIAADNAFAAKKPEAAIPFLVEFAQIVFEIEPFKPKDLPDGWEKILHAWVLGKSMSDLAGGFETGLIDFIEGTLVYRLVWALESVRVRALAVGDATESLSPGRAAVAVETGTPEYSAALLIQSGLSSRVAAIRTLGDCPSDFEDAQGLREWLGSAPVVERQNDDNWPTPETALLWKEFVSSFHHRRLARWLKHEFSRAARWFSEVPDPGLPVRVVHRNASHQTLICTPDWTVLGELVDPLPQSKVELAGIFVTRINGDSSGIVGNYLGPD